MFKKRIELKIEKRIKEGKEPFSWKIIGFVIFLAVILGFIVDFGIIATISYGLCYLLSVEFTWWIPVVGYLILSLFRMNRKGV